MHVGKMQDLEPLAAGPLGRRQRVGLWLGKPTGKVQRRDGRKGTEAVQHVGAEHLEIRHVTVITDANPQEEYRL